MVAAKSFFKRFVETIYLHIISNAYRTLCSSMKKNLAYFNMLRTMLAVGFKVQISLQFGFY